MRYGMRSLLGMIGAGSVMLLLGACDGSGSTCGDGCPTGFTCQDASCALDPAGQWVITVTNGLVNERATNGDSWDAPGGLPDPFVCLTVGSQRSCTSAQSDTLSPVWNQSFPAVTAAALLAGVQVEYTDEDVSVNDPICAPATLPVAVDNFQQGQWSLGCTVGQFNTLLRAR